MNHRYSLPDIDHLSLLSATILLAYALSRFINIPLQSLAIKIPGIIFTIPLNVRFIVIPLVAGLTAAGIESLLLEHPFKPSTRTYEHWILPTLTAWVIGIPVIELPYGPLWWLCFAAGSLVLMSVFIAEYIIIDPQDVRYPLASSGLVSVSFGIYLVCATALQYSGVRLFIALPIIFGATTLVCLRTFHLNMGGRWAILEAEMIAVISAQLVAALHYWPLSPVSFGLAILGPVYAATMLVSHLTGDLPKRSLLIEPASILILSWIGAFWLR